MLRNAYFLEKIGADTAENERKFAEILPKICNFPSGPAPPTLVDGAAARRARGRPALPHLKLAKLAIFAIFAIFANFWRARSRLYQNEILQENMRLTAFFNLYNICILLHRYDLKLV